MDSCIANSISQRTSYLLRSMGHTDGYGSNPLLRNSQSLERQWDGGNSTNSAIPNANHGATHIGYSKSHSKAVGNKPMMVKSKSSSNAAANSTSTQRSGPNSRPDNPLADGMWGIASLAQVQPDNLPRYDTFYNNKSYQPLPMFNFFGSKHFNTAGVNGQSKRPTNPHDSYHFRCMNDNKENFRDLSKLKCESSSSLDSSLCNYSTSDDGCDANLNKIFLQKLAKSKQAQNQKGKQPIKTNKTNSVATRCQSAIEAHRQRMQGKSKPTKSGACSVRKSVSENPDHNNNFYKGGPGIFFTNRLPMPGRISEVELTGQDRINLLAQPKSYCFCDKKEEQFCRTSSKCCASSNSKKFTPEMMERVNYLSQPKLCHYTVCSCCLSPNCLGECSTKFNINKTTCKDPSCVDWDRLATPRPQQLPPTQELGAVKSSALKVSISKRIDRLSIPRKTIDSGDYYLWLWNKKPDTRVYLNPVHRLSVSKCDMKDTRVLLRCDLDFSSGKPIDCKVRDALPTMKMALKKGARSIVIISRCGPAGVPKDPAYSLKPLAQVLEQYLETPVIFLDDCVGFQAQALCEDPVPGSVFLLENLSFHPEEVGHVVTNGEKTVCKKEDIMRFQRIISDHGDVYITDSFNELVEMSNTTVGYPTKEFGYGFNIKKELSIFNKFALSPPVPVLAIIAGPFDKTWAVVRNLMGQVTDIMMGGHLAAVFTKALKGIELGKTEYTEKWEKKALKLFSRAKDTQTTLHLPSDIVVRNTETDEYFVALTREDIDEWFEIADIGPHTRKCYTETIRDAAAILWLGDFGPLMDGTEAIKAAYLDAAKSGTPTYAADDIVKNFISIVNQPEECLFVTGDGNATLQLLRGQTPKGLAVLSKSRKKRQREPIPEDVSTKPISYELPGDMIIGGANNGASYGASNSLLCINHLPVQGLKVLIRVEFNEPTKDNIVTNNYRMRMTIPTIKYALKWRAKAVIILAHFGEPQGRREADLSLKPICDEMANLIGETVIFVPKTVGKDVMTTINQVHPGSVLMVENVRFQAEEEQNFLHVPDGRLRPHSLLANPSALLPSGYAAEQNAQFCEELSRLGDIYVNDAFAALHRDHASITGNFRPVRACGFLVKNELKYLAKLLNYPSRKFLVILGGTRMEDKLDILPGILKEADSLILAGMMACLFLKVEHGLKTGRTHFSPRLQERAKEAIKLANYYKCRIHYPVDLAVSQDPEGKMLKQVSISEGIPKGYEFIDIGKLSAPMFSRIVKRMNMIFWTGLTGNGKLEYEKSGTKVLMEAISAVTHDPEKRAVTIVGGRGLSQVVEQYDPDHSSFTHLTTGGRVALQLLAERHVIGLDCLLPRPGKRPLSIMGVTEYTDFRDANVLIRCDLDVPKSYGITPSTFPLQPLVETVKYVTKKGAKVITLISQRGDPDGEVKPELSLDAIQPLLEDALEQSVVWVPTGVSEEAEQAVQTASKGTIILLENIGFHPEESGWMRTDHGTRVPVSHEEIAAFRSRLSQLGHVYVNESFGTLHRSYSSVIGFPKAPRLAGFSLKKQVYDYVDIRRHMENPILLIIGTEELEDLFPKLMLLYNALDVVDNVFLSGNVAAAFRRAEHSTIKEFKDAQLLIPRILKKARLKKVTLNQATDCLAAKDPSNPDEEPKVVQIDSFPRGYIRCDIGPTYAALLSSAIQKAKMIILCGTTGPVIYDNHLKGTKGVLDQIAAVTSDGSANSVALGMRAGQFLHKLGHTESFTGYSVEPAPFFDIVIRKPLPGLQVLDRMPTSPLKKLSMEQMNLRGKRVLLRLDLDVPSVEGVVLDTDKLEDAAATITYCLGQGAKCVVLLGHRGEPGGYKNYYLRMEPLVVEISAILGIDVTFIDRPCSKKAKNMLQDPPTGSVFLMENLKFYPAECGIDAEVKRRRSFKRGEASLTEVSEIPKDETQPSEEAANEAGTEQGSNEEIVIGGPEDDTGVEEEDESISDDEISISDGEGGQSVDSLMFQLMRPKTVEQFTRDLAECGDVYINDDVAHVEEPLISYQGFGLDERGCGFLLAEFLRDSEESSVYQLPGIDSLSPAP